MVIRVEHQFCRLGRDARKTPAAARKAGDAGGKRSTPATGASEFIVARMGGQGVTRRRELRARGASPGGRLRRTRLTRARADAETFPASNFINSVTVGVSFPPVLVGPTFSGQNSFGALKNAVCAQGRRPRSQRDRQTFTEASNADLSCRRPES